MEEKVLYKRIEIPRKLVGVIEHMADVEGCREDLQNLGNQWDLLTILGQMSGTGTDMTGTRGDFANLTAELLAQLGQETLKKTVQELSSKTQVAVDIVIRNLFERTADIGFLATDDDIRDFIRHQQAKQEAAPEDDLLAFPDSAAAAQAIRKRFEEYVAKYSVYHNIILLDTTGRVLVQLDEHNSVTHSNDPLVQECLQTNSEYVEVFRESDLLPQQGKVLLYAYRVTESNESEAARLGVLCLCFRFENEMEGVFDNLHGGVDDWSVMTILDRRGEVIASNDVYHIPLGAKLPMILDKECEVIRFAGRQYLAKTCATKGYQGFLGLGWYGHVMIPLERAFNRVDTPKLNTRISEDILASVMNDPRLFSDALRSIPKQADRIQRELERTVWNGNVREADTQSKVLLWNISDAGARTKQVFEDSIENLHETVISTVLSDVQFQAALAVDIMDRNLYERANDCRWWALTTAFRRILSKPEVDEGDQHLMTDILAYINGLYTVYTNLFVFNQQGVILAVSNEEESQRVGSAIPDDWARRVLSLKHSQQYCVSPFVPTCYYGDRHTYIYGAAIAHLQNHEQIVGGIGIVFDSEPQFRAMLQDSLPRQEDHRQEALHSFAVFADAQRSVISASSDVFAPGDRLDINADFFALKDGRGMSSIIAHDGVYYAVGAQASSGYREYKRGDGYANKVVALVFTPLAQAGKVAETRSVRRESGMRASGARIKDKDRIEIATFFVDTKWLGMRVEHIEESVPFVKLTTVPGTRSFVIGDLLYRGEPIPVVDIRTELRLPVNGVNENSQVVVVNGGGSRFGLLVDALGEIPDILASQLDTSSSLLRHEESYIEGIVKPAPKAKDSHLLVVLDPEKLVRYLIGKS